MLAAEPMETGATLLEKALKRFNRTLGKEAGNPDDYILKVREKGGRGREMEGEGREAR